MPPAVLSLVSSNARPAVRPDRDPRDDRFAARLIADGVVDPATLAEVAAFLPDRGATLAETLASRGIADAATLAGVEAAVRGGRVADLERLPPDPRLIDAFGANAALSTRVLPWRRLGALTVVVVSTAERFETHRKSLTRTFGEIAVAYAPEDAIAAAIVRQRRRALAAAAETRVDPRESSRTIWSGRRARLAAGGLAAAAALAVWHPVPTLAVLTGWALFTLVLTQALRLGAAATSLRRPGGSVEVTPSPDEARLPVVSLLVPLYRERRIAGHLLQRLERLDYPRECLDVLLIAESDDGTTRETLRKAGLLPWMRVVVVPPGTLRTKPRAMNYALDFARGAIVGVYDAEDAPDPDQINTVVRRFRSAPPDVACLQGALDFYNPRQNWLSRCFTVDYAAWFRVILPGLARMGIVIPLGGTTLFFRREVLERLGGWDAHNVTEDADLGIRLARRGYRTELIDTVTHEEANCWAWPWIRQRSRWLKGYAITYAVHMRSPARLLGDLGPWKFAGFQILFLGTLSQFVLAPLLWSFWLILFGVPHPLAALIPPAAMIVIACTFLLAEVTNIAIGMAAVRGPDRRWLMPWVPTLHVYWLLGAVASWKALWEMAVNPFYWDKTDHGGGSLSFSADPTALRPRRPLQTGPHPT